jgi:hypothetical protein
VRKELRMSRLVAFVAVVLLMTVLMAVPAFAQMVKTPGAGNAFGDRTLAWRRPVSALMNKGERVWMR